MAVYELCIIPNIANMACSDLFDVGVVNTENLLDAYQQYDAVSDFLHADLLIGLHATTLSHPQQLLSFSFDVDGLVVEFNKVQALQGLLHYLFLPKFNSQILSPHYVYLKKHMDLSKYTSNGLTALKNCVGYQIANVDGGYHLLMTAVPSSTTDPDTRLLKKQLYSTHAVELLNSVTDDFKRLLRGLSARDKSRPTLQKQGTSNTARFNVLWQDLPFIMSLLDKAVEEANSCRFLQVMLTLNQFGQKAPNTLELTDIVDVTDVKAVSVHLAVKFVAIDYDQHILFSRYGLQDLVGARGKLFSVLGMHEATNFQTNLDHLPIDVAKPLLAVLSKHGKLNFLQLYVDSPHCHLQMPFKHPVSGAIVTCGLSHPNSQMAMLSRASTYLRHMTDLKERLVAQLGCRIEQVLRFQGDVPLCVDPSAHFDLEGLHALLRQRAMLVPFKDTTSGQGLLSTLDGVLGSLIDTLASAYSSSEGVGRFDESWKAFQCELALEEMFYGHPLSSEDFFLSASLGTSTVMDRSLTHQRGFIGLAPHSSASSEETPPPLHHWTRDELQKLRIERLWPLCQTLDAGPAVIGVALIRVLLGDLYRRNANIPMSPFSSDSPPGKLVGAMTLEILTNDLETKNSFPVPNTFHRARQLVQKAGKSVKDCLLQGFIAEKLHFFPAFKFRDIRGGKKIWWNFKDFLHVHLGAEKPFPMSELATRTLQVCTEMERRSLAYSRSLEKYRDHGMPWMAKTLQRLPPTLKGTFLVNVLTFISSVGMLQNNDYVDFNHLKDLLQAIGLQGMAQDKLQKLQILGKFTIEKVYRPIIWKLHHDIPVRVQQNTPCLLSLRPPPKQEEGEVLQPEEDVQAVEDQDDIRPPVRSQAMCLPANSSKLWTQDECAMVNLDKCKTSKQAYTAYVKRCVELKVPSRTFNAFRQKRKALQKQ